MRRSPRLATAFAASLVAGCATATAPPIGKAVFQNPQAYVGREVRVCGYLIGPANILRQRDDLLIGLSIHGGAHAPALARAGERAHVCLRGTIGYLGCDTDPEIICTDAAFDYVIEVAEILRTDG